MISDHHLEVIFEEEAAVEAGLGRHAAVALVVAGAEKQMRKRCMRQRRGGEEGVEGGVRWGGIGVGNN